MSKFKLAAIFGDDMVLQSGKGVRVFGSGENGEKITVSLGGAGVSAVVENGRWLAVLPPAGYAVGLTLTASAESGETVTFRNVAAGEVWLAGGQSNMELELQSCPQGVKALSEDKSPNVRYYYTPKNVVTDDKFREDEEDSAWCEWGDEEAKYWSAAGYFFAKEIAARTGAVVGIVGCNWGGTSASSWMSRESLAADADIKREYVDAYESAIAGKSAEELDRLWFEYEEYHDAYYERELEFFKKNPLGSYAECEAECGENRWPGPVTPRSAFRAYALYEPMVKRVCPYTLAGFIWYQGETDADKPELYYKLFSRLIKLWREDWGDGELPFLFCQLPSHRYADEPDYKNWAVLREAQDRVAREVKNALMAVLIDCGEFNDIHPKDKKTVGERLALLALKDVYGKDVSAYAPLYGSYIIKDGGMELTFINAEGGLVLKNSDMATGFELAGRDGVFYEAAAKIAGEKIFIKCRGVPEPEHARYLWTNYAEVVSVYGANGIPLAPFRTGI
ncbi:MAG: sialate O-acetylesterase [Oscillospiraceae bacterium]|jgi:sialate O-acetylesterase|nr:sialate O-acetylesterase [Oscillospiraceae bacterium]